ncbi:MAG: SpoIID/LytB domain-containing protein [Candidatus Omnitrophica bacterium]|nr:SpoIID/LytB domain-containing protein [Candidatus Omnitrophota bacterium]
MRVLIAKDISSFNLRIKGYYELIDYNNNKSLGESKNLNAKIYILNNFIFLKDKSYNIESLLLKPKKSAHIMVDGREYRGSLLIIRRKDKLYLINFVDLDDYIKGVLNQEVSSRWPMEVLKAQAIVSRTYALYCIQDNRSRDYDLTKDVYSQVYGGRFSERLWTNLAVNLTKGKVLLYKNEIFPAYFHATCGGATEDASQLWNIDIPPLKGVICNFCKDSPHYRWQVSLDFKSIEESLKSLGLSQISIKDIIILERTNSGRVRYLKIITTEDKQFIISAKDFRNAVGPDIIRSTNFILKVSKDKISFEGIGWGHGVGMCQWGAYFMAKRGYSYKDILKYYFPNSTLASIE